MLTRNQAFEELRRNLELTGLQEKTVATRQSNVRDAVARQLTVVDDFLTGSYRRHTLIVPLKKADVDVVVVLDRGYKDRGPRAVPFCQHDLRHLRYVNRPGFPGGSKPWSVWSHGTEEPILKAVPA